MRVFCTKCGNEVAERSAFCSRCGNPLGSGFTQPIRENQVSDGNTTDNPSKDTDSTKKKKKRKIIVSVIVALLVVVIGVAAAFATDGFGLLGNSEIESSDDIEVSYEAEESDTSSEVDSGEESTDSSEDESDDGIKDTVEEYTWKELSAISNKIANASDEDEILEIAKTYNLVNENGALDGSQTKSVTLTDGTETSVQIAGFAHDDKSDGSGKAGITFIFTDAIAEMYINSDSSNAGGWESSDMRSWLASDGKALLPKELQDVLVAVDKSMNSVGEAEDISSVTTTSDELWLFAFVELAGELDESVFSYADIWNAEGSQYKLFSDCGVNIYSYSYDILAKTYQGDSCFWWGRSLYPYASYHFMCVFSSGGLDYGFYADNLLAVVPGFCI